VLSAARSQLRKRRRLQRCAPARPTAQQVVTGPGDDEPDARARRRLRRNAARSRQRAEKREKRVLDPMTGERVSLDPRCKHGTEPGYTNFGCNCLDVDDHKRLLTGRRERRQTAPGCKPVGLAASNARKQPPT
jgi:hypothetical protein